MSDETNVGSWLDYVEMFLPIIRECLEQTNNDRNIVRKRLRRRATVFVTVRRHLRAEDGLRGRDLAQATKCICEACFEASDEELNDIMTEAFA